MAISLTAEAIVLAINSAIKLGDSLQRAYANSIKAKTILLPLPQFDARPNVARAHRFFKQDGKVFLEKIERVQMLFEEFDLQGLSDEDQEEYIDFYVQLGLQLEKDRRGEAVDDTGINLENMVALLRVRQWESDKMKSLRTSPIKIVAGTLVEIGIDYFNQVPGALNPESSVGRAMKHFLSAIDDIKISELENFKELSELIVPQLFIVAAESIESLSKEISGDEKVQAFIAATSRGVAEEVIRRTRHAADDEATKWGQLVLRSMVKNAGNYVFNSPADLFHTNEGVSKLIQSTGNILLEAILTDPDEINLKQGFNIDMLDRVVRSALGIIAEHPQLIDGRNGFRNIVMGVSASMAEAGIKNRPDLLPELVRLILEHTAGNIQVIIQGEGDEDGKHLLVIAVQQLLVAIAKPVPVGRWRLELSKGQLLGIAEHILQEVVTNPNWILAKIGNQTLLQASLEATFLALSGLPKDQRLNKDVIQLIIQTNIQTVVINQAVLDRIHWGDDEQEATILQKALDLLFHFVFVSGKVAPAERIRLFSELLRYISQVLLSRYPDARGLLLIDLILFQDPDVDFSQGFRPELLDQLLEATLEVLDYRPDLISNDKALQHIIEGVAGSLKASGIRKKGLLLELVRLILECTADNVQLIIKTDADQPTFLLVDALGQLLKAISQDVVDGQWKPELSGGEVLAIAEDIFDDFLQQPEWVRPDNSGNTLFGSVLETCLQALGALPKDQRFKPENLAWLLRTSLRAAAQNRQLLSVVKWGTGEEEKIILEKALDLVFAYTFPEKGSKRTASLEDLLEYVLEIILSQHQDKKALMLLYLILFEDAELGPVELPQAPEIKELIELALKVISAYPELISKDAIWQKIIQDTAKALKDAKLNAPDLLPEMLRLTLFYTADHIDLLNGVKPNSRQYVLTEAIEQCLRAIAKKPRRGKWKPQLSRQQILDIVQLCLEMMVQNPLWVKNKLLQVVLEAIFEALQIVPANRKLPHTTVRLLIEKGLQAVSFRKKLAIEVVHQEGSRKIIGLTFALEGLFMTLYDDDEATETASWTLTQSQILESILDSFLLGLMEGPITKEALEEALEPVKEAISDLADNAAFSLETLLEELEK